MIELAFLAAWNRLMNWGLTPIIATRTVAADGDVLRAFLSTAANQWRLVRGCAALEAAGKHCHGGLPLPLGARLRAGLSVKPRTARVLEVEVKLGRRTIAWATWIVTPGRGTTDVDLAVQLESRGLAARLALLLGGRRWIGRRLELALATLATTAAHVAEELVAAPTGDDPAQSAGAIQQPAIEVRHPAIDR